MMVSSAAGAKILNIDASKQTIFNRKSCFQKVKYHLSPLRGRERGIVSSVQIRKPPLIPASIRGAFLKRALKTRRTSEKKNQKKVGSGLRFWTFLIVNYMRPLTLSIDFDRKASF